MKTKTIFTALLLAAMAPVMEAVAQGVVIGGRPGYVHSPWPASPVIVTVQPVVVVPGAPARARRHDRERRPIPAVRVAPGYEPRSPVFPSPGGYVQSRLPDRRGQPTVVQAIPGYFFPEPRSGVNVQIAIGSPRAHVLAVLGRPTSTVMKAGRETLIFGGKTIVIQNGVVAVIR